MTTPGNLPTPEQGLVLTHFLTVRDVVRSRRFYADTFGGEVVLAGNPAIVQVANSWIIMNPGGGPTPDKPEVTLVPPENGATVSRATVQPCLRHPLQPGGGRQCFVLPRTITIAAGSIPDSVNHFR